jgi:demethylmenaquinone methyltransferase / 2-methoxy-6-polyprenyl-1,4-benzoquinol methylase
MKRMAGRKADFGRSRGALALRGFFSAVPRRYDAINRGITLGMDRSWRRRAARECLAESPTSVLDAGCGTGDLALEIAAEKNAPRLIAGFDFSAPMLEVAREKARARGLKDSTVFLLGDLERMPFENEAFDRVGIAFAFRNITWANPRAPRILAELRRVLRPGGKLVIVESSQPSSRLVKAVERIYLRAVARPLARLLGGARPAYGYLFGSVERYYDAEKVSDLLGEAGFGQVTFERLFLGAAALHVAVR